MGIGAAIGLTAATSLAGAAMQSSASKDAASVQTKAAQSAQQLQQQEFNTTQQNLSPWMTTGTSALSQLASLYGLTGSGGSSGSGTPNTAAMQTALENYPGYQFTLNQGEQALDRTAASRGLTLSGAQLKDSQAYGQGLASSTFSQYLSGLTGLSNSGLSAANSLGGFASNYASSAGNDMLAAGQAQASGIVGSANAWSSGLQGALGNSLYAYQAMNGSSGSSSFSPINMGSTVANPVSNPYADVSSTMNTPGFSAADLADLAI